jgi:hypothetical protein
LLLIDGLDEFDDRDSTTQEATPNVRVLLNLFNTIRAYPSTKICVSSRPFNEFEIEFGQNPEFCFPILELTCQDIHTFVDQTLTVNPTFRQHVAEDKGYASLVKYIVDVAEGVFLWVFLACGSLLDGIPMRTASQTSREGFEIFHVSWIICICTS